MKITLPEPKINDLVQQINTYIDSLSPDIYSIIRERKESIKLDLVVIDDTAHQWKVVLHDLGRVEIISFRYNESSELKLVDNEEIISLSEFVEMVEQDARRPDFL